MADGPILVTGAAGFIGFHVARRLLSEGRDVVGVDNMNAYYDPALKEARRAELAKSRHMRFAVLDLADREATAALFKQHRFPNVVHLAAQAGVRHSLVDPFAYIDANLAHSDLSPDTVARHMGCSRRYVHRAFEGEGATLERFIWDRRLESSRAALLSPERSAASISEIAFACGFNSGAHFSRAFKKKYALAPRDLRKTVAVH